MGPYAVMARSKPKILVPEPIPRKAAPLGVRLEADEREALERAAAADHRPTSSMARLLIAAGLQERGWLASKKI